MAEYLYKKLRGDPTNSSMNLQNFEYHEPFVARKSTDKKQMMHTEATLHSDSNTVFFRWYNVETDHWYASGAITFENSDAWMADWSRINHLITSRIEHLQEAAENGRASKLSRHLAYRLFANLVDWSEIYKGMQTAILDRMEACAEVQLSDSGNGEWYIPPWDMEALVTLSGFVLNGSDVMDTKNNFFITPGYKSSRFAKPLKPGCFYQSYVKMMPTETPNLYSGDVYILEAGTIVAVMEKVLYRSWPRIMLQRFFVPPEKKGVASKPKSDAHKKAPITNGTVAPTTNGVMNGHQQNGASAKTMTNGTSAAVDVVVPVTNGYHVEPMKASDQENGIQLVAPMPSKKAAAAVVTTTTTNVNLATLKKESDIVTRALDIIADAAGVDVLDLKDEANFMDLGVDSLMSLVLAQNFRSQLGVEVRDSIFVEFFCIGDLCRWLEKC